MKYLTSLGAKHYKLKIISFVQLNLLVSLILFIATDCARSDHVQLQTISTEDVDGSVNKKHDNDDDNSHKPNDDDVVQNYPEIIANDIDHDSGGSDDGEHCWTTLNGHSLIKALNNLNSMYGMTDDLKHSNDERKLDSQMKQAITKSRGVAERALHSAGGSRDAVPAGFNLGDHLMLRLNNFLHRIKLRNDTHFVVKHVGNTLKAMTVDTLVFLNDLHLVGDYERVITDANPSNLFYRPTYGKAEFLLRNVTYKMQGRYRVQQDRLAIELVLSQLLPKEALLLYVSENGTTGDAVSVALKSMDSFLKRIKANLDEWLKDYFNDQLIYLKNASFKPSPVQYKWDSARTLLLNDFVDSALRKLKRHQHRLQIAAVKLPSFTIYTVDGKVLKLTNGVVQGLDTFYRRSAATTATNEGKIFHVDSIIGFSDIKVTYTYECHESADLGLGGELVLAQHDATVHLNIQLLPDTDAVGLKFEYLNDLTPGTLTVNGGANVVLAKFRHILDHHVMSLMYNSIVVNIEKLDSLVKCEPDFDSYNVLGDFDNPVSNDTVDVGV